MKKHLRNVHEGKKDHKCEYCGKEYTDKKNLCIHIKREHDNVSRNEQCNQCGKLFFTKEVLNRHVRNMHKHLCDEAFPTNSNLVEHKNVKNQHLNVEHPNDIEYDAAKDKVCSICGEEFLQVWYFSCWLVTTY